MRTVRRVLLLALALASPIAAVAPARAAPAPAPAEVAPADGKDIRRAQLADGIWQFTTPNDAYVQQLNTIVVECADDVLVFDTQTRPSCARAIIAQIKRLTPKPVRFVVNSHWHPDHWSGNAEFVRAWPGLDIVATVKAADAMEMFAEEWPTLYAANLVQVRANLAKEIQDGKQADGTPLTPELRRKEEADVRDFASLADEFTALHRVFPTLTYTGSLTLDHGGRTFRLLDVTGDAPGTTVLYMPREKILLTGDAVSYPIPYSARATSQHLATLRELDELDVDTIVPGHGPAFHDKDYLRLEAELLETIVTGVRAQLAHGVYHLPDLERAITCESLRERFTHGDAGLDQEFRDRVKAFVKYAATEARDGFDPLP